MSFLNPPLTQKIKIHQNFHIKIFMSKGKVTFPQCVHLSCHLETAYYSFTVSTPI